MAVSRAVVGSWAFLDYTNSISHEPLNITANKIAHPATAFGHCSNRTVHGYLFLFVVELCCSFFFHMAVGSQKQVTKRQT